MSQKIKVGVVGFIVVIVMGILSVFFVKGLLKPNDEVMSLEDCFFSHLGAQVTDDKAAFILNDELQDCLLECKDNEVYVDYYTVTDLFNKRMYWDSNEKLLLYTLPDKTIEVKLGEKTYTIGDETVDFGKVIVYEDGGMVQVSLSFVEHFSSIKTQFYSNPNRVVVYYGFDNEISVVTVEKDTQLRYSGSAKGEILRELAVGDKLTNVMSDNTEVSKGYIRVVTEDGVFGYVKESDVSSLEFKRVEIDNKEVEYSSIKKDYEINLVWNMVANETANSFVSELLDNAPGVNTISPTWFAISDTNGGISSLASHDYVEEVHSRNIEVWGLVNDFTPGVSIKEILTHTTSRRNLVDNIISKAKEYKLDGVNVDFEYIKEGFASDYLQFLRELSVECRKEKLVLSVDSYVPMYSQFYDRKEQGEIVDYVVIMAYDEHDANSTISGSVASISWTKTAIEQTKEQVLDYEKIIIGIPFYDRLWKEEISSDGSSYLVEKENKTMGESMNWITEKGVSLRWDDEIKQNYAEYTEGRFIYKMWLEDAKSIEEKLKVIDEAEVGGIGCWRLGQETNDVWPVINKYINN